MRRIDIPRPADNCEKQPEKKLGFLSREATFKEKHGVHVASHPEFTIVKARKLTTEEHKTYPIFHPYMRDVCGFNDPSKVKILDFGCGSGEMVRQFQELGYDAYGCDLKQKWLKNPAVPDARFKTILMQPYRLPYEDEQFDVVFSSSVLEHAKNKMQCFWEIHRVLKPGGYAMHVFPGKWYLPSEPHIYVPLANYFWPTCPRWWLVLWALLGVRNGYQTGKSWRHVADLNQRYCQDGLSYWKNRRYRELSLKVFGNHVAPMQFYLTHAGGGTARLFQKLPFKPVVSRILGNIRNQFIVSRKKTADAAPGSQPVASS